MVAYLSTPPLTKFVPTNSKSVDKICPNKCQFVRTNSICWDKFLSICPFVLTNGQNRSLDKFCPTLKDKICPNKFCLVQHFAGQIQICPNKFRLFVFLSLQIGFVQQILSCPSRTKFRDRQILSHFFGFLDFVHMSICPDKIINFVFLSGQMDIIMSFC